MTNWSGFATLSGARVTTWSYDAYRGFPTGKTYDAYGTPSAGPSYTFTAAGRLASRLWARGTNTAYSSDTAGGLSSVSYNDGYTPSLTNYYDRLGRVATNAFNSISSVFTLDLAGDLLDEAYSGGPLSGLSVTNGFDTIMRRTNNVILNGSTVLCKVTNNYDTVSRLSVVSDGTNNATYSYLANSMLVSQIVFKQNSTTRMTTTKAYDFLNRLTGISSAPAAAGQPPLSYLYAYNNANQRTQVTTYDGSYWKYTNDTLGRSERPGTSIGVEAEASAGRAV